MNINLHIERLVLEGLPVARHEAPQVRAAIEAELSRLLTLGGLDAVLLSGGSYARAEAGGMSLPRGGGDPAQIGSRIAGAVYGGFGGEVKSGGDAKGGGGGVKR
ncbi:MAG TPA: hypothetical protein VEX60_05895 [Pyrinomonadaceae bacterium]|nr:hypothetical protein [Pyrinomonadaceae bacterium]